MLGSLLIRSLDTAEHINIAMQARGFDRKWRTISKLQIHISDLLFAASATFFLLGLHFLVRPLFY